ncbi:MAG: enoyl-CoA hydratase-related protein, partial [Pseudomonadota bacterium]|nr:enoyl-CoA hydratase-related protein [Pseudomonadota bacterium]
MVGADHICDYAAAFDVADADDSIGAIILTGAGRAFCAGADLSAGGGQTFKGASGQPNIDELGDSGGAASRRIFRSLKPVIVAF